MLVGLELFAKSIWGLHHEGPHQLIVFVVQEVAVVDVPWVFDELVLVNVEVGVRGNTVGVIVVVIFCLGPPDPNLQDLKFVKKSNFFPFALVFMHWDSIADVFEIAITRIIAVSSFILFFYHRPDIKTADHSRLVFDIFKEFHLSLYIIAF